MVGDRVAKIDGDLSGVLNQGDNNRIHQTVTKVPLPPPEQVDITKVLAEIRAVLARLPSEDAGIIKSSLDAAESEAVKPSPSKDRIGKALSTATAYAKDAAGFGDALGKLTPLLAAAASWIGANGPALLQSVGLST